MNRVLLAVSILVVVSSLAICILVHQGSYVPSSKSESLEASTSTPYSSTTSSAAKPVPKKIVIMLFVHEEDIIFQEIISYTDITSKTVCMEALNTIKISLLEDLQRKYLERLNHSSITFECLSNGSVLLTFKVYGKIWISGGEKYADFLWFLKPNNLDFIENRFKELKNGLSWSGVLEGVPVEILIRLPSQEYPYRAWGKPVGHCHGHAWWPVGEDSN